ncbi:hypothetical protein CF327_g5262 [Tilletia walkeri]|nr:hypothetical protein CF327_g5262 [Tilletia walkeri]
MPSLFDLPASLLIDSVLCHLSPRDLTHLAATSHYARSLADADLVWARRLATDFHFPLDSSARPIHFSSQTGWKTIYARLSNPSVFVWGDATRERLGQDLNSLPAALKKLVYTHFEYRANGIPFPIPVPNVDQPHRVGQALRDSTLKIGPPVQLHSTGWAFFALTSSGHIIFWGCLDGEVYYNPRWAADPRNTEFEAGSEEERILRSWTNAGISVENPTILPIPPSLRVTQLGSGRKHAIALARVRPPHEEELERAKELSNSASSATNSSSSPAVEQSQAVLLEWQAWGDIVRIDPDVIGLSTSSVEATQDEQTQIVQVEAGWEYSAVLVHRHQRATSNQTRFSRTVPQRRTTSDIFVWLTSWSGEAERQPPGRRLDTEADSIDAACSNLPTVRPVSVQLPPLPPPPQGLLSRLEHQRSQLKESQDQPQFYNHQQTTSSALDEYFAAAAQVSTSHSSAGQQHAGHEEEQQLIIKIAAGTSFLIALTSKGLVYRLELLRGRRVPANRNGEHSEDETARAFRSALYSAWASGADGEGWELLESFCIPDEIAKCGVFASDASGDEDENKAEATAALRGYVDPSIQITHISAHFRNFAAYSVAATSQLIGRMDVKEGKSIVLLGDESSTLFPDGIRRRPVVSSEEASEMSRSPPPLVQPRIIPTLQARSIIKVVQGDWHAGALDAKGNVMAWGQWSNGALGVWDSLPLAVGGGSSFVRGRSRRAPPGQGGPMGRVRSAMGAARGWLNGSSSEDGEELEAGGSGNQGDSVDNGEEEDVDVRMARRATLRACSDQVEDPLEVRFIDWRESRPTRKFVFDLAMSGQHSGALAVDLDDDDGSHEGAQRSQVRSSTSTASASQ